MRFRIVGDDERTGETMEFILEARHEDEAREKARDRGLMVKRVEPVESAGASGPRRTVDSRSDDAGPLTDISDDDPSNLDDALDREDDVWSGRPSQWENLAPFLLCALVLPVPWAFWRWLTTRCTRFEITSQRLRLRSGVFTRTLEEIEVYRVKDTTEKQSLLQRLVGVGTVTVYSSDRTLPELSLHNIRGHDEARDLIRAQTERMRRARKVRELDID